MPGLSSFFFGGSRPRTFHEWKGRPGAIKSDWRKFGTANLKVMPTIRGRYRKRNTPKKYGKRGGYAVRRRSGGRGRSRATYSTRTRSKSTKRYASRKVLGVGLPPRINGTLKCHNAVAGITSSAATMRIGQMNLVDMNNNQRTPSTVTVEGASHWMTGTAGAAATIYNTPYYFDSIKSLYTQYYITDIWTSITFYNRDTTAIDDITIAYKIFKPHDDEAETARNATSSELIMSQDRIKSFHLNPTESSRTGGSTKKTIVIKAHIKNWVPARVWFSEQEEIGVGEKTFASTLAFDSGNASHQPRVVFWAWKTTSGTLIDDTALSLEQLVWYTYTGFGRKLPAVS